MSIRSRSSATSNVLGRKGETNRETNEGTRVHLHIHPHTLFCSPLLLGVLHCKEVHPVQKVEERRKTPPPENLINPGPAEPNKWLSDHTSLLKTSVVSQSLHHSSEY